MHTGSMRHAGLHNTANAFRYVNIQRHNTCRVYVWYLKVSVYVCPPLHTSWGLPSKALKSWHIRGMAHTHKSTQQLIQRQWHSKVWNSRERVSASRECECVCSPPQTTPQHSNFLQKNGWGYIVICHRCTKHTAMQQEHQQCHIEVWHLYSCECVCTSPVRLEISARQGPRSNKMCR